MVIRVDRKSARIEKKNNVNVEGKKSKKPTRKEIRSKTERERGKNREKGKD